jgi:hypothetical protein
LLFGLKENGLLSKPLQHGPASDGKKRVVFLRGLPRMAPTNQNGVKTGVVVCDSQGLTLCLAANYLRDLPRERGLTQGQTLHAA